MTAETEQLSELSQPTEYFLDYDYLTDRYKEIKIGYEQRNPDKNYDEEIYHITDRYLCEHRYHFLKFGPYWWAVKALMKKKGFSGYGGETEIVLRDAYTMRDPITNEPNDHATLIAAWEFKDYYNDNYFQGNRDFDIYAEGDFYSLWDDSWERQFPGFNPEDEYLMPFDPYA